MGQSGLAMLGVWAMGGRGLVMLRRAGRAGRPAEPDLLLEDEKGLAVGGGELGVDDAAGGIFLFVGEGEAHGFEFFDAVGGVFGVVGEGGSGEGVGLVQADDDVTVGEQ